MLSDASSSGAAPRSEEGRPCVLLIDNDADVAHTISSILRQARYDVAIAADAGDALAAVRDRTFDVVLLELALAESDGLSLLTELRRSAPTTYYIVLTGDA